MSSRKFKEEYIVISRIKNVELFNYGMGRSRDPSKLGINFKKLPELSENDIYIKNLLTDVDINDELKIRDKLTSDDTLLVCANKNKLFYKLVEASRENKICVFIVNCVIDKAYYYTCYGDELRTNYIFNLKKVYTFKDKDELDKLLAEGWLEKLKEKSIKRSKKYYEDANYRCDYDANEYISTPPSKPKNETKTYVSEWSGPGSGS